MLLQWRTVIVGRHKFLMSTYTHFTRMDHAENALPPPPQNCPFESCESLI